MSKTFTYELSVIMPCLNEAETLESCIKKAWKCINENNINAEVLIADNGSTDGSIEIAKKNGARVVHIDQRGYGAALIGGTLEAKGQYCIMGDADDSYDFSNLMPYLNKLREGYDLVMGNRFRGGIEKGAMPFLHRYLGTPVISFIGRLFYHNDIYDFNCGMRGFNTQKIIDLDMRSTGMEYASEMIIQSALHSYKITEVPTTLAVDGRSRKPYLNTWSDGWRHLKLLLLYSPNWLFLVPGWFFTIIGALMMIFLEFGPVVISNVTFDVNTMLFGSGFLIVGINLLLFSLYTKVFAVSSGYIPVTEEFKNTTSMFVMEKAIFLGLIFVILGLVAAIFSMTIWARTSFGNLNTSEVMRITIPAITLCILGANLIFAGFLVEILKIQHK